MFRPFSYWNTSTPSVSFTNAYAVYNPPTSNTTTTLSGSVTIVGVSASFRAFCYSSTGSPVSTNISVGGSGRYIGSSGIGTYVSSYFTLSPGTYSYSVQFYNLDIQICNGGMEYTQP